MSARIEAAQKAAQQWWDEFVIDTGCHPDFIWREKHNGLWLMFADFNQSDATQMFVAALNAADECEASESVRLADALRFYADPESWRMHNYVPDPAGASYDPPEIVGDGGMRARSALAAFDARRADQ